MAQPYVLTQTAVGHEGLEDDAEAAAGVTLGDPPERGGRPVGNCQARTGWGSSRWTQASRTGPDSKLVISA